MSKDIVRVRAPYILEVTPAHGQGLFDQEPYNLNMPDIASRNSLDPKLFRQSVLVASNQLQQRSRLPVYDFKKPSRLAREEFGDIENALQLQGIKELAGVVKSLQELGNILIEYPNWLRYLYVMKEDQYKTSYDKNGDWIREVVHKAKDGEVIRTVRTQMEAAESYGYWAYLQQVRLGIIPMAEVDPTVLKGVETTSLIQAFALPKVEAVDRFIPTKQQSREPDTDLGERYWELKKAPLYPILAPNSVNGAFEQPYKERLAGFLD